MILLIRYGSMELRTFWTNLNSIMILLIRLRSETFDASQDNLNSIMILLIPSGTKKQVVIPTLFKFHYDSINSGASGEVWSSWWKFKFHYDSINSRPKIIPLFKPKNVSILSTSSKFNISFLSLIIYFCNTSYFRRFRLLSIPYIFCTIMGRQKPPNFSSWFCSTHSIMKLIC